MKTYVLFVILGLLASLISLTSQAQDTNTTAESKLRAETSIARAIAGFTNFFDERVVVLKPEINDTLGKPSSAPQSAAIVELGSARVVRIYTLVPPAIILPPQRFYETTIVSRVTLINPARLSFTTNGPSFGVERTLSSVMIPVSTYRDLKIEQITLPSTQVRTTR
ncbi:MAG: hypothetical protein U1F83_04795 [Verrucomicrobiota bacterium]